jgi:hypothetical protein
VIGNPPGKFSLLREKVMDDPAQLRASIRTLAELDFDVVRVKARPAERRLPP